MVPIIYLHYIIIDIFQCMLYSLFINYIIVIILYYLKSFIIIVLNLLLYSQFAVDWIQLRWTEWIIKYITMNDGILFV